MTSPRHRPGLRPRLLVPLTILGVVLPAGVALAPTAAHAATISVTTTVDEHLTTPSSTTCASTHGCSLRAAVEAANNAGGSSDIQMPAGTYTLTLGALQVGTYPSGQTSYSISITGVSAAATIVTEGSPTDRVFSLDPGLLGGVAVTLAGLTVSGGSDAVDGFGGAGIIGGSSSGSVDTLALTGVAVTNNHTRTSGVTSSGGGLQFIGGNVTITGSTFSNNSSGSGDGGGAYIGQATSTPATVVITGSTFTANALSNTTSTLARGAGLALAEPAGSTVRIDQDTFTGNTATGSTTGGNWPVAGGGLSLRGPGSITRSTFVGNAANGPVDVTGLEGGGAVDIVGGAPVVFQSNRVVGNSATNGPSGVHVDLADPATSVDARFTWFGCNTPPVGTGCDRTATNGSAGTLTLAPFAKLAASAAPGTIRINASSTIKGAFVDSTGAALPDTTALTGVPATFDTPVLGSVPQAQPESLDSSASATATYNAGGTSGDGSVRVTVDGFSVTAPVTVLAPLALALSANPASTPTNTAATLTHTVTNPNTVAVDGSVTESLPAGLVVASTPAVVNTCGGTVTAAAGATSISWTASSVAVGSCAIDVNVSAGTDNVYAPSATVTSTQAGTGNAAGTHLTVIDPPVITKVFGGSTVPLGGSTRLTFTLSSTNQNLTDTGVGFTDALPVGMSVATPANLGATCDGTPTAADGASTVSLSGASLPPASSCTIGVDVVGTTTGQKSNSVQVASTNGGTGNTSTAVTTVMAPPSLGMGFGAASIPLNATTTLTFTLANPNSTGPLSGIGFTDTLPAGLVVATPNNLGGSCPGTEVAPAGGATITVSGVTLAASASCTVTVDVKGIRAGNQQDSVAAVSSTEGGSGGPASAGVVVVAPPQIGIAFNPSDVPLNGTSDLIVTITNPAANVQALTGVAVTDALPSGVVAASGTTTVCGGTLTVAAPSSISLTGATIAQNSLCTFAVTVAGQTSGAHLDTTGPVSSTNGGTGLTASATLTVASPPTITPAFGAATVPLNGTTSLTFTIANPNAGSALSGLAFSDTLPSGLVVATPNGLTDSCNGTPSAPAGGSMVGLTGGTLAADASCAVVVNVVGTVAGDQSTSVGVTSNEGGPGATSAPATVTVVAPPVLVTSFDVASIPLHGTATLRLALSNPNVSVTLTGVGVVDTLPAGLAVASPNGVTNGCGGSVSAAPGATGISLSGASVAASSGCDLTVVVTGIAPGHQTDTAGPVTSVQGGTGNVSSAPLTVVAPPVLGLHLATGTVPLGGSTTLTVSLTNPAPNTAGLSGVGITVALPAGLAFPAPSGLTNGCGGTAGTGGTSTLTLTGGTLAPSSSCSLTITVQGSTAGSRTLTGVPTSTEGGTGLPATASLVVTTGGYWLVGGDGGVFPFGDAAGYGSAANVHLNRPMVGMAATPDGGGYWLVAADGGVFPFGDAAGYGSTAAVHLNAPIVGIASTRDGRGYWLVGADGGVFPFGDAVGYGSAAVVHLNRPMVGIVATPGGGGYWLVAADGGVFPFGDAAGYGSTGSVHLNAPIVGMAAAPAGGYWLVGGDGGVFPFGPGAAGYGSLGAVRLNAPVVAVATSPTGGGYWLFAADGGVFPFGDALGDGSAATVHLNRPVVGGASTGR